MAGRDSDSHSAKIRRILFIKIDFGSAAAADKIEI
jgi:hypothetical protein